MDEAWWQKWLPRPSASLVPPVREVPSRSMSSDRASWKTEKHLEDREAEGRRSSHAETRLEVGPSKTFCLNESGRQKA